jgi:hypothetical protein
MKSPLKGSTLFNGCLCCMKVGDKKELGAGWLARGKEEKNPLERTLTRGKSLQLAELSLIKLVYCVPSTKLSPSTPGKMVRHISCRQPYRIERYHRNGLSPWFRVVNEPPCPHVSKPYVSRPHQS